MIQISLSWKEEETQGNIAYNSGINQVVPESILLSMTSDQNMALGTWTLQQSTQVLYYIICLFNG